MKLAFVLITVLICSSSFASDDSGWKWVKAGSVVGKGWDISEGTAQIMTKGTKFTARFFGQTSSEIQIVLDGTIENGRITAKEEIQGSDYTGSVYHGTLVKKNWQESFAGTSGGESITLSDGWNMIGINRDLH